MGVDALRLGFAKMAQWMGEEDPALFVVDVSSEVSMLARLCSVPTVTIRMHGDRTDIAHTAAYSGSVGLLAPFDESLEELDVAADVRARTRYLGGIARGGEAPLRKEDARRRLGIPTHQRVILAASGGGGAGSCYASLTVGARAVPSARWIAIGHTGRAGHETDFANLRDEGWVEDPMTYVAAADLVVSACGDNLIHEVARVGRPLLCVPEWCYYEEQRRKGLALQRTGTAAYRESWPASFDDWRTALAEADAIDVDRQRGLVNPDAARDAASYLERLIDELWSNGEPARLRSIARGSVAS